MKFYLLIYRFQKFSFKNIRKDKKARKFNVPISSRFRFGLLGLPETESKSNLHLTDPNRIKKNRTQQKTEVLKF